ncbi:MAG: hypothetical protein AB7S38_29095 [Vulcanimicrobiota bacterium]
MGLPEKSERPFPGSLELSEESAVALNPRKSRYGRGPATKLEDRRPTLGQADVGELVDDTDTDNPDDPLDTEAEVANAAGLNQLPPRQDGPKGKRSVLPF